MATCKVVIEMEIEGEIDDATSVIDQILDEGVLQDEINKHEYEDLGPLEVLSVLVRPG